MPQYRFPLIALLCAVLAAIVLLPGMGGAFILDDKPTISENPVVQVDTLAPARLVQASYGFASGGGSRPLPMLTFAVDHWRAGLDPAAFRATNILIHALTTLVLAGFLHLLLGLAGWGPRRSAIGAAAMALAWAVHPLQVSSVLYIVQRMQTMGTLFLVLALHAYVKMRQAQRVGQPGRQHGVVSALWWVLALACKEDSILLPAYAWAIELTVLRFRAADARLERRLRGMYWIGGLVAVAGFVFYVLPREWTWSSYPGRDFSTPERLLTQARVLAMYVGQILWPLPGHLPFYHDDLAPSRGILQPWTTLPSILLLSGLLVLAWRFRHRRPIFALGVLLFLAGHAVASNVFGLELAFEHRNHFPLIGAVVACGDLLAASCDRFGWSRERTALAMAVVLLSLGAMTAWRAREWGSPVGFAEYGVSVAPRSERAWINLCQTHFELSRSDPRDPHFSQALEACEAGAERASGATNLTNLVLLRTIDGSVGEADWERLLSRLRQGTMTPSDAGVAWHLVRYSNGDKRIDARNVLRVLDMVATRWNFRPEEYVAFGYYAVKNGLDDAAQRYFQQAVEIAPPTSAFAQALIADLEREGLHRFARSLTPPRANGSAPAPDAP